MISVNGDGAFGINAMEIDTAVRHGAKAVFVVANNAAWNIERLDQEMNYGGRVVGTTLRHSDYAAWRARWLAWRAGRGAGGSAAALERALANAPALVDVVTSQTVISSDARKGLGFVPAIRRLPPGTRPSRSGGRVDGTHRPGSLRRRVPGTIVWRYRARRIP